MSKKLAFTLLVLLLLLAVPVGVAEYYRTHFYPGTTIASIDVSNKSYSQAQRFLQEKTDFFASLPVTVFVPEPTHTARATVGELGITFANTEALDTAWKPTHQQSIGWPGRAIRAFIYGTVFDLPFTQNPQAITNFITVKIEPLVKPPVPATITIVNGSISVVPSIPGLLIDRSELTNRLKLALRTVSDGDPLIVQASIQRSQAAITEATLQPIAAKLTALGNIKLTLSGGGIALFPSRSEQLSWYSTFQDKMGVLSLNVDESKVVAYLRSNARVDTVTSSTAVSQALTDQIAASTISTTLASKLTLKPVVSSAPGQVRLGLYPGKYIQVNLAEQKLYQINGSNLEQVYRVSTGKSSTPTPTGTFTLSGHARRPLSSLYGLYMPYWINFKDGAYGMHELPEWPNGYKEGEGHLGVPVSDGCIRLGVGEAKEVYDWTPDGTPLLIQ